MRRGKEARGYSRWRRETAVSEPSRKFSRYSLSTSTEWEISPSGDSRSLTRRSRSLSVRFELAPFSTSSLTAPHDTGTFFLYQILGWAALAGISVAVAFLPVNHWASSQFADVQQKLMSTRDRRTSMMNEVLAAVRMIKFFAFEGPFEERILKARQFSSSPPPCPPQLHTRRLTRSIVRQVEKNWLISDGISFSRSLSTSSGLALRFSASSVSRFVPLLGLTADKLVASRLLNVYFRNGSKFDSVESFRCSRRLQRASFRSQVRRSITAE